MSTHPVICITEVPTSVVDKFLDSALTGAMTLAPNSDYGLTLVTTTTANSDNISLPTVASRAPMADSTSPFLGWSVQDLLRRLDGVDFFVILDQQSVEDECTAVLAARQPDGTAQMVRVMFDQVQILLTALHVATLGFAEVQKAAESEGGIYGAGYRGSHVSPVRGGPAPRKRLGREA